MPENTDAPPAPEPDIFANLVEEIKGGNFNGEPEPTQEPETPKPVEEKPAVEEKKPDSEEEEIKPPENMSKKASEDWDKLKDSNRNYKAKAIAAEAAIVEKES